MVPKQLVLFFAINQWQTDRVCFMVNKKVRSRARFCCKKIAEKFAFIFNKITQVIDLYIMSNNSKHYLGRNDDLLPTVCIAC